MLLTVALVHTDKSGKTPIEADGFGEVIARNFYLFDGTPPDGILDDGAVFYLNGEEVGRTRMPDGNIGFDTSSAGGAVR